MTEKENHYMVYKFLFPGGEIYIGKSKNKSYVRWGAGNNYGENTPVGKAIRKYGWKNVITSILYENLTKEEACILEQEEIDKHGGINHHLVLNVQSGGDYGYKISDNEIEANRIRNIQYNKDHPEKAKKHSIYMKQYLKENPAWFEDKKTKIRQYRLEGSMLHFIAEYESIAKAAEITGIYWSTIQKCLTMEDKFTAGGYYWTYAEHINPIVKISECDYGRVPVYQIDPDTLQVINRFPSIKEAVIATGAPMGNLSSCLHGKRNKAGGFIWKTEEQLAELHYNQYYNGEEEFPHGQISNQDTKEL